MTAVSTLFDLTGKGVCLTGGAGYLGRSMVQGLLDAGAITVVCDVNKEALSQLVDQMANNGAPGKLIPVVADVNDEIRRQAVLEIMEREAGGIHGWINNAYGGQGGLLTEATRDQLESTVIHGLARVMEITRDVGRRMITGNSAGSIVNISSMYGIVSPQPDVYEAHPQYHNPPAYGAAKAGMLQYTRYAACHFAPHHIRVNAISPGPFPNTTVQQNTGFVDQLARRVPLGRIGRPEELIGAVVFLLSGASTYVTGHNLVVDGGWTAW